MRIGVAWSDNLTNRKGFLLVEHECNIWSNLKITQRENHWHSNIFRWPTHVEELSLHMREFFESWGQLSLSDSLPRMMIALRCLLTWESIGKHPHRTWSHNKMFMSVWCPEDSKAIKIKIEGCHFCQEIDGCHFVRKTSHFRGKDRVLICVPWSP